MLTITDHWAAIQGKAVLLDKAVPRIKALRTGVVRRHGHVERPKLARPTFGY
jgi:hypothetical protein